MIKITPDNREYILELARRRRQEKYRYYTPNGKVEEFINLVGENQTFICLFSAANGVGKSAGGANILANLFWPNDNPWFKHEFFRNFPYPKTGRIICPHTTVQSTTIPTLKEWFPLGRYTTAKHSKPYEYHWQTDTGFEFDVMTIDQDVKEFESSTLGWAWFDEPPPEAIYKATIARMRKGGIIFITATPLTGSAWIYDQIYTNPKQGQRQFVEADVEANCKEHGVRGILEHNDILRMVQEYTDEDKQARVFGRFQHLTGLVFKMFTPQIHVIRPFAINWRDFCVIERLDPHPRNPDAVGWYAIDRRGTMYVIDELYGKYTLDELAIRIKNKAGQYRVIDRRIDPWAYIVDQHTNISLAQRLDRVGLTYLPASKDRTQAIMGIRDKLDYQQANGDLIRPPQLYVFDTCVRHIWEFQHWQYNEYTGKAAEKRGQSERPQDKDDHMMENLGRAIIDNIVFQEAPAVYNQSTTAVGTTPTFDPY